MRLLITGGAGFIGSNFIRYWSTAHGGDEIINLDLLTYAGDRSNVGDIELALGSRYAFVRGDIADAVLVADIMHRYRPDLLVNFAAESHNSRALADPDIFVRTNVVGTHTLLEAARRAGVARFHHISTCEVYGDMPLDSSERFNEESPYRPRTPYNASKAAADLLVRAYHHTYGLGATITNSSNTYGAWQHPEKMIPLFTTNALDDLPLPVYRQSANRREWLHVEDHCGAIEMVILGGRPGQTYNVGSGEERSVDEIADAILALLGKPRSLKRYVQDRPGHDRRYLLDHGKIERELGWQPRIPFAEGLRHTVDWYRAHREWWAPKKIATVGEPDEFAWDQAELIATARGAADTTPPSRGGRPRG